MKQPELIALTGFIVTLAPVMQMHPLGGVIAATVGLVFAFICRRKGK